MRKKHRKILDAIFSRPTQANIRWDNVEALLKAFGTYIEERKGCSPDFSHLLVTKRRKGRPDKARDRGPRKRTVWYVEEAAGAQRSQGGSLRRCSRGGVRNAG